MMRVLLLILLVVLVGGCRGKAPAVAAKNKTEQIEREKLLVPPGWDDLLKQEPKKTHSSKER